MDVVLTKAGINHEILTQRTELCKPYIVVVIILANLHRIELTEAVFKYTMFFLKVRTKDDHDELFIGIAEAD